MSEKYNDSLKIAKVYRGELYHVRASEYIFF